MTVLHWRLCLTTLGFWTIQQSSSFLLPNATALLSPTGSTATGLLWGVGVPRSRRKRYLSPRDMSVILDYHNQVRAQVSPPAANMEYMVSRAPAARFWVRSSWVLQWGRGALPGRDRAPMCGRVSAALDSQLNVGDVPCPRCRADPCSLRAGGMES